jgi:DNA-binding response OmpR family regulator
MCLRILIVEDEVKLAEALVRLVAEEQIQADAVFDGEEGLHLAMTVPYDAIVLDRMLPGMNGLEIVVQLRQQGITTPILLLTARDSVSDRVEGLNTGADDYLVKPFATEELLARIHALARRPTEFVTDHLLEFEGLRFDLLTRTIEFGDADPVVLSPKETQILEMLIRHAGQVLTRQQLIDHVWGYETDVLEGVLDTYVHHLRRRLYSVQGPLIQTVRGVGYTLKKTE